MKDRELLATPTASMSPLVIRHPIAVPAAWQGNLRTEAPTSITAETVMAGTGPRELIRCRRSDELSSEKCSTVVDGFLFSQRS
jgi:hypothetical protein